MPDKFKVIIFSEEADISTNEVINWLHYYNVDFVRINSDDFFDKIEEISFIFSKKKNHVKIDEFNHHDPSTLSKAVWFRRITTPMHKLVKFTTSITKNFDNAWGTYVCLLSEHSNLQLGIFEAIHESSETVLGNLALFHINKLKVLNHAQKVDIDIPETIVTNNKRLVEDFLEKNKSIICKPIDHSLDYIKDGMIYTSYTEEISREILDTLPERFFPSLFQEKLEKEIEIRTFYLAGQFFSTAIFSQLDQQTEVDMRRYNFSKSNRQIPFKLPEWYRERLDKLMCKLELNTGSIDTILTKDGRYVFLEINPVGQFIKGNLKGNFYLHKKIAKFLCNTHQ